MNEQAPDWLTIFLSVLAVSGTIVGTWLGAWFTARRDDQRAKLEHRRELDLRQHQAQREDLMYWRERRRDTYIAMLDSWGNLLSAVSEIIRRREKAVILDDASEYKRLATSANDFLEHLSNIGVDGSLSLMLEIDKAREDALRIISAVKYLESKQLPADEIIKGAGRIRALYDDFAGNLKTFRLMARRDLDVPDSALSEIV